MNDQRAKIPTAVWVGGLILAVVVWRANASSGPPQRVGAPVGRPAYQSTPIDYSGSRGAAGAEIGREMLAGEDRVRQQQQQWDRERREADEASARRRAALWR